MRKINRNKRTHFLWGHLALMLVIVWCASAWAKEGIFFKRSSLHSIDSANNVYLVSGQIDYQLSPYLEQALLNGIVLNAKIQIVLVKSNAWWWNQAENISTIDYQLKYHIALSSTLSPATLRLPLKIQSIFSSQYSMSSEVITWPLP